MKKLILTLIILCISYPVFASDINAKNERGYTPLMQAVYDGNKEELVKELLDNGADLEIRDDGEGLTVLMIAAASNQVKIVGMLIDAGADLDAKESDGFTAIDVAGKKIIIRMLKKAIEERKSKEEQ